MSELDLNHEIFKDIIGQSSAIAFLNSALLKNQLNNAYLFCGPNGVGKSLAAIRFLESFITQGKGSQRDRRRLSMRNHPDFLWVEPTYINQGKLIPQSLANIEGINPRIPPQIRLQQVREISRFVAKEPVEANRGMVIIDAVETMAEAASNALLKTLEEPGKSMLILISARPEQLLSTICSRCQKVLFSRLSTEDLKKVFNQENNTEFSLDEISVAMNKKEIISLANGSPGEFINCLSKCKEIPEEILSRLTNLSNKPLDSLAIAKDVTEILNVEQQIWAIQWMQQNLWENRQNEEIVRRLEKLKKQIIGYVQPRLAWEVALLEIAVILNN